MRGLYCVPNSSVRVFYNKMVTFIKKIIYLDRRFYRVFYVLHQNILVLSLTADLILITVISRHIWDTS